MQVPRPVLPSDPGAQGAVYLMDSAGDSGGKPGGGCSEITAIGDPDTPNTHRTWEMSLVPPTPASLKPLSDGITCLGTRAALFPPQSIIPSVFSPTRTSDPLPLFPSPPSL